jgi:hypothetical protein
MLGCDLVLEFGFAELKPTGAVQDVELRAARSSSSPDSRT